MRTVLKYRALNRLPMEIVLLDVDHSSRADAPPALEDRGVLEMIRDGGISVADRRIGRLHPPEKDGLDGPLAVEPSSRLGRHELRSAGIRRLDVRLAPGSERE